MSIHEVKEIEEVATATAARTWKALGDAPIKGSRRPPITAGIAGRIEHTLLGMGATDADVARVCREVVEHSFRGVCCLPRDVGSCRAALDGSGALVVTVLDFPLSGGTAADAAEQCRRVVDLGADELDMVIDVRAVRRDDVAAARDGVRRVVEAAQGHPVKVILETGLLSIEQIVVGCVAAEAGGAAFVKTCTGFGPRGATEQDVTLIRAALGARLGLKASGGIGNRDWAARLVGLGADVIGTSKGPECV